MIKGLVFHQPFFIAMPQDTFPLPDTVLPTHQPEALVELRAVTCGYGDRIILEDINLVVPRGKVVALMGLSLIHI